MRLLYAIVNFYLFYNGDIDMQIWFLLTWNLCKVSAAQVTVNICGPIIHRDVCYLKSWLIGDFAFARQGTMQGVISNQH